MEADKCWLKQEILGEEEKDNKLEKGDRGFAHFGESKGVLRGPLVNMWG